MAVHDGRRCLAFGTQKMAQVFWSSPSNAADSGTQMVVVPFPFVHSIGLCDVTPSHWSFRVFLFCEEKKQKILAQTIRFPYRSFVDVCSFSYFRLLLALPSWCGSAFTLSGVPRDA